MHNQQEGKQESKLIKRLHNTINYTVQQQREQTQLDGR